MKHLFRSKQSLVFVLFCLGMNTLLPAQSWDQIIKSVASDRGVGDQFGYSVSISGDYAIVGAPAESEDAPGGATLLGAAYIFKWTGATWAQEAKIVASDRGVGDLFGHSVSISGDYAIVGAIWEDENATEGASLSNAGSAYIFKRTGTTWAQEAKIVASDRGENDEFGYSVSISGDYAIIGTVWEAEDATGGATLSGAGSAYIFKRTGMTWAQEAKIVASDRAAVDFFGTSVSISGDYAIVGAFGEDEDATGGATLSDAGSAYIFKRTGTTWAQEAKIVASDRAAEDWFGLSVSISGDYAIVGAFQEDENATGGAMLEHAGSAYIFQRTGTTWTQEAKIVASDRAAEDQFGYSVSISGDYAIIGAPSEDENATGGAMLEHAGSAYIFQRTGTTWAQEAKIVASDRTALDLFGYSVSISGDYAIVGAIWEDENATGGATLQDAGSACFYQRTEAACPAWYLDADNDNYYTGSGITQCTSPGAGYKQTGLLGGDDCNDGNAAINLDATEVCDGVDNNCNGITDEGVRTTYYRDMDGDGFGNPSVTQKACAQPSGYVTNNTDCDDANAAINPNTVWYLDADNDNYYTGSGITQCTSPGAGYKYTGLTGGSDCNDNDNTIYPGATDICDGKDNDCDGTTDEGGTGPAPGWGVGTIGGATNATSSFMCNSGSPSGTVFNITSQGFSGAANADLINSNYQQRCGDASITARIAGSPAPGWAGIYIREDLSAGSKMVALKTNLSSFLRREVRSTVNGNKTTAQNPLYASNSWVRIERTGNTFAFYSSPNGATWSLVGSTTVTMGSCVYIGLFAESINAATTINASFDNVAITGGAAPLVIAPGLDFEAQEENQSFVNQILVYPNPSTGQIQIGLQDFSGKAVRIKVSNSFGSTVLNKKLEEALDTESLDLSEFAPGVYWLQVQAEGSNLPLVQKVILSK